MDPATAALAIAPLALSVFRRPKRGPNRYAIVDRYRRSRPVGYTTAEDIAASERTRTRMAGAGEAAAQRRRAENVRQVSARGLSGAAAAALEEQASDISAGAAEEASRTSADQLYKAFQSNLGYERHQNDTAFGAELGLATEDAARADAQNSTFWNSLLEAIPNVAGAFSGLGQAPVSAGAHVGSAVMRDPSMLDTSSGATLRGYDPRQRVAY